MSIELKIIKEYLGLRRNQLENEIRNSKNELEKRLSELALQEIDGLDELIDITENKRGFKELLK